MSESFPSLADQVQTSLDPGRTKLMVSRLHSRLLEARHMPGWKTYLRDIFIVSHALAMREREVRDIQTSLLVSIASIFFSLTAYVILSGAH
jgi:hypothetical protein